VDFFLPEEALAIQVCYNLHENLDTYEREVKSLVKLSTRFPDTRFLILTDADEETIRREGIKISVLPVWKWLLAGI
jgi:predicted AAA+ superfamily ATPase